MHCKTEEQRIIFSITSLMQGGAERWCCDLAQALQARGATVAVIATYDGPFREKLNAAGIPVILIVGTLFRYDPLWWIRYIKAVRAFRPTVIIGALWIGNSAARIVGALLRVPTILTLHAHQSHEGKIRRLFDHALSIFPGHRVAVSPQIVGADSVIANGIDLSRIPVKSAYEAQTPFTFLCVGRLVPVKRFDRAINTVELLIRRGMNVKLEIIGDGPLKQELSEIIRSKKLEQRVILLGQKDAAPYYAQADCFLQTSDSEGLSLALLEAVAAGLPAIITHQSYEHPVIYDGKTGYIALLPDPEESIILRATELYSNKALRKEIGTTGQTHVHAHYGHEQMVEKYCTLIQSVQYSHTP